MSRSRNSRASTRRSTADGALNDVNDVKIAMTNASAFAYVADGQQRPAGAPDRVGQRHGWRVRLQPAARAEAHRHLQDPRAGARHLQGAGSRSRRGRKRQSGGGLRPPRWPPVECRRDASDVSPRRKGVDRERRARPDRPTDARHAIGLWPSHVRGRIDSWATLRWHFRNRPRRPHRARSAGRSYPTVLDVLIVGGGPVRHRRRVPPAKSSVDRCSSSTTTT